ncbi:5-methylcytosine-specific restriction protein A [Kribbella pratensis]|uniref:5-methylcytosine-specific restriction protein A n=2 Tax=Kribbella pratensis TaxID=2512112 RepID=A0A4R8BRX7_9ACTN|nr:5-methylcytosine-specific restriction protein A [Kribbella pratensis]
MEVLGERPVWSMSDSEKLSALDAVVAEKARLETLELHLIAAIDQSGYATELGAGDTARLLTQRYRTDAPEARRQVRIATHLTRYAATSAALPDPAVPYAHPVTAQPAPTAWHVSPAQAAAIVSVLNQVPATVPTENLEFAEQQLIDLAATHTPAELRQAGRRIRDILDPDGPEPDEKAAYDRESLTLKTVDRGVTFRGYLANENAELLRTLIHAHAKPHKTVDGELDPRPRDKRQADALTAVLNSAATAHATATAHAATTSTDGDFVAGHGPRPHISITIDYNDLAAATANATGHLTFGDNLSAATVRRLACDAQILPMVLGTKSQPLDVGTTQRLVTRPMRRALNARDKGCVVCGAPPIQCEAHHIISWLDGGPTAITNLALLCKRHHLDLHSGHWHIQILNGTVQVTRPTWADPTPIPPSKYKPPIADIVHQPPAPPFNPWGGGEPVTPTTRPSDLLNPLGDDEPATRPTSPTRPTSAIVAEPIPLDPWNDTEPAA